MREALGRNFDVIVVVWVLALALGWMLLALVRADPTVNPWGVDPSALVGLFA